MSFSNHHPVLLRPVFIQKILCYSFNEERQGKISNLLKFASVCKDWHDTCHDFSADSFFPQCCVPIKKRHVQDKFYNVCSRWTYFSGLSSDRFDSFFKFVLKMLVHSWVIHRNQKPGSIIRIMQCHGRRTIIFHAVEHKHEELVHFLLFEVFEEYNGGIKNINLDAELECSITEARKSSYCSHSIHENNTFEFMMTTKGYSNTNIFRMFIKAIEDFALQKELDPKRKQKAHRLKLMWKKQKDVEEMMKNQNNNNNNNNNNSASAKTARKHLWYSQFRTSSSEKGNLFEEPNLLFQARSWYPGQPYKLIFRSPLATCAFHGKSEFIKILLEEQKCNPNFYIDMGYHGAQTREFAVPIMCCFTSTKPEFYQCAKLLIDAGATTNIPSLSVTNTHLEYGLIRRLVERNTFFVASLKTENVQQLSTDYRMQNNENILNMMRLVIESPALCRVEMTRFVKNFDSILQKFHQRYNPGRDLILDLVLNRLVVVFEGEEKQKIFESMREDWIRVCPVVSADVEFYQLLEKHGVFTLEFLRQNILRLLYGTLNESQLNSPGPQFFYATSPLTKEKKSESIKNLVDYFLDHVNPDPKIFLELLPTVYGHGNGYIYRNGKIDPGTILHHAAQLCSTPQNADVVIHIVRSLILYVPEKDGMRQEFLTALSGSDRETALETAWATYKKNAGNWSLQRFGGMSKEEYDQKMMSVVDLLMNELSSEKK